MLFDAAAGRHAFASEVDRRLGNTTIEHAPQCGLTYPGGAEGAGYADSAVFMTQDTRARVRVPRDLRTGRPFVARVDLLPDGRCAFALDGVPLWVSPATVFGDSAVVNLSGQSVRTMVRIGELTVRSGTASEIDWSPRASTRGIRGGSISPARGARTP